MERIAPTGAGGVTAGASPRRKLSADRAEFGRILQETMAGEAVHFSQHALARLERREIALSFQDMERLRGAISLAAGKGARESLILLDDLALVVSITNRTVITALKGLEKKERVFTNIDSAVIV
ncbi:MAG: hypothetical protein H5U00_09495 [Clostridia bacterium]|nr:hypothetical protein [Clostridia bacterium]